MPAGSRSTAWFEEAFGFTETPGAYSKNQAHFQLDGEMLVCSTSKHPKQHVGLFQTPSLAELRERCAEARGASDGNGLRLTHLSTPTGVQSLIADPSNAGSVFQAASQFNCLEMTGPGVSPRQGIAIYAADPTQGPKCAMACPAATAYRNYLCLGGAGQGEKQIDCLGDVAAVVGNDQRGEQPRYWSMQNGYALPVTPDSMRALGARLRDEPGLAERAEASLRVGVHWDTSVRPPQAHRVAQVFASAVPVAYSKSTRSEDWEPFARLVLRAAYEATLAVGCIKAAAAGGRVKVFLTSLGGGAFGNRHGWIVDAMLHALEAFQAAPLDVVIVHYGTIVPKDWQSVQCPPSKKASSKASTTT